MVVILESAGDTCEEYSKKLLPNDWSNVIEFLSLIKVLTLLTTSITLAGVTLTVFTYSKVSNKDLSKDFQRIQDSEVSLTQFSSYDSIGSSNTISIMLSDTRSTNLSCLAISFNCSFEGVCWNLSKKVLSIENKVPISSLSKNEVFTVLK